MIVLLALAVGIVAGWMRGGRVRNLENLHVKYAGAVLVLFVVQSILRGQYTPADWLTDQARVVLWCICAALLLVLTFANRRIHGFLLVFAGFGLNLLVIAANGGMPLAREAAIRIGGTPETLSSGLRGGFYRLATTETHFAFLGDVIPFRGFTAGGGSVLSVGDLLMLFGVVAIVAQGMGANVSVSANEDTSRRRPSV